MWYTADWVYCGLVVEEEEMQQETKSMSVKLKMLCVLCAAALCARATDVTFFGGAGEVGRSCALVEGEKGKVLVDCGAITACLETATGVSCQRVFGKPNPDMLQVMMKHLGIRPSELLMAGDREHTDIESGIRAGARTLRISTGVGGGTSDTRADYSCADLGVFCRALFPEDAV